MDKVAIYRELSHCLLKTKITHHSKSNTQITEASNNIYTVHTVVFIIFFIYSSKNHFPILSSVKILKTAQLYFSATTALINIVVSVMVTQSLHFLNAAGLSSFHHTSHLFFWIHLGSTWTGEFLGKFW